MNFTPLEMILQIDPYIRADKINTYLDWLDEFVVGADKLTLTFEQLYTAFCWAFPELDNKKCKIIFGIWLATNKLY